MGAGAFFVCSQVKQKNNSKCVDTYRIRKYSEVVPNDTNRIYGIAGGETVTVQQQQQTKLRTVRISKGFSTDEMAQKVGVSTSYYRAIENGGRSASDEVVTRIETILDVDRNDVFEASRFQVKAKG